MLYSSCKNIDPKAWFITVSRLFLITDNLSVSSFRTASREVEAELHVHSPDIFMQVRLTAP